MNRPLGNSERTPINDAAFQSTHWSIVLAAGSAPSPQAAVALEQLCRAYWYPLYAHARRQGCSADDAPDLIQEFFARLLRLNSLRDVARERGRFRTFLLRSLNNFLADAWDKSRALKRGGGQPVLSLDDDEAEIRYAAEFSDGLAPDKLFDRGWALTVLTRALTHLEQEFAENGKGELFSALKQFLSNEAAPGAYDALAPTLGMTARAVSMAVCRLRQRYAQLVRAEVSDTVAHAADVEAELNYLFEVAGQ